MMNLRQAKVINELAAELSTQGCIVSAWERRQIAWVIDRLDRLETQQDREAFVAELSRLLHQRRNESDVKSGPL